MNRSGSQVQGRHRHVELHASHRLLRQTTPLMLTLLGHIEHHFRIFPDLFDAGVLIVSFWIRLVLAFLSHLLEMSDLADPNIFFWICLDSAVPIIPFGSARFCRSYCTFLICLIWPFLSYLSGSVLNCRSHHICLDLLAVAVPTTPFWVF